MASRKTTEDTTANLQEIKNQGPRGRATKHIKGPGVLLFLPPINQLDTLQTIKCIHIIKSSSINFLLNIMSSSNANAATVANEAEFLYSESCILFYPSFIHIDWFLVNTERKEKAIVTKGR